jgi:hypothetical protein
VTTGITLPSIRSPAMLNSSARRADALEACAHAALASGHLAELCRVLAAIDPNGTWLPEHCQAEGLPLPTAEEARAALRSLLSR